MTCHCSVMSFLPRVGVVSVTGEHPRLGALDVCPFIPVQGVSMEECVECAQEFGEKLAEEFGIPGQSNCILHKYN